MFSPFRSVFFSFLVLLTSAALVAQTATEIRAGGEKHKAHKYEIQAMMTTPDGSLLITVGDKDKVIKLWSLPVGKLMGKLQDKDDVTAIAVTPDGKTLASANFKGITLWSLTDRKQMQFFGNKKWISKLKISPDGKNLVALEEGDLQQGDPDRLRIYSLPSGQNVGTISPSSRDSKFMGFAFLVGGTQVVTHEFSMQKARSGEPKSALSVWSLDGQLVKVIACVHSVRGLAASRDGKLVAASCTEGQGENARQTVRVWSMPDGELLGQVDAGADNVEFSADGRIIAVPRLRTSSVLLWSVEKRTIIGSLDSPDDLHAMAISPDGQFVAAGYEYVGHGSHEDLKNQKIVLWSVTERRPLAVLFGHTGPPSFLTFTPDSRMLITGQESYAKSLSMRNMGGGQVAIDMRMGGNEGIIGLWATSPPQFQMYLSD
jgi:WD40 repeat protein